MNSKIKFKELKMIDHEKGYAILHNVEVDAETIEEIKNIINEYSSTKPYSTISYWDIETKIRIELTQLILLQIKTIMCGLYWQGCCQEILGEIQAPAELEEIQIDYKKTKEN